MKIAVATNQKGSLKYEIAEHFGRAKNLLIYDTESCKFKIYPNPEISGKELPPDFLNRFKIDTVITFGLGPMAFGKFKNYKIKMYKAIKATILENIEALKNNKLRRLTKKDIL